MVGGSDFADFDIDLGAERIHTWVEGRPEILEEIMNGTDPDFATFPWTPVTWSVWNKGRLETASTYGISIPCCCQNPSSRARRGLKSLIGQSRISPKSRSALASTAQRVRSIMHGTRMVVKTASGVVHEAGKVLVTVPITILQNGSIHFSAAPPERQQREVRKRRMPEGFKVSIKFSERFWPDWILFDGIIKGALGHE